MVRCHWWNSAAFLASLTIAPGGPLLASAFRDEQHDGAMVSVEVHAAGSQVHRRQESTEPPTTYDVQDEDQEQDRLEQEDESPPNEMPLLPESDPAKLKVDSSTVAEPMNKSAGEDLAYDAVKTLQNVSNGGQAIEQAVTDLEAGTARAAKKAKEVEGHFSKYNKKLADLTEALDKTDTERAKWHKELIDHFTKGEDWRLSPFKQGPMHPSPPFDGHYLPVDQQKLKAFKEWESKQGKHALSEEEHAREEPDEATEQDKEELAGETIDQETEEEPVEEQTSEEPTPQDAPETPASE